MNILNQFKNILFKIAFLAIKKNVVICTFNTLKEASVLRANTGL